MPNALGKHMNITFEGPMFFSTYDETAFFEWIENLDGFQSIQGAGTALTLVISEPLSYESVRSLLTLFRRWQIEISNLSHLKNSENADLSLWTRDLSTRPIA